MDSILYSMYYQVHCWWQYWVKLSGSYSFLRLTQRRLSSICACLGYDLPLVAWIYRVFFMPSNPFGYMSSEPYTEPVNPLAFMWEIHTHTLSILDISPINRQSNSGVSSNAPNVTVNHPGTTWLCLPSWIIWGWPVVMSIGMKYISARGTGSIGVYAEYRHIV